MESKTAKDPNVIYDLRLTVEMGIIQNLNHL